MSAPAFVPERGEIWYADGNSGFYVAAPHQRRVAVHHRRRRPRRRQQPLLPAPRARPARPASPEAAPELPATGGLGLAAGGLVLLALGSALRRARSGSRPRPAPSALLSERLPGAVVRWLVPVLRATPTPPRPRRRKRRGRGRGPSVGLLGQQGEGVGKDVEHGVEALDGARRRARGVQHDRPAGGAGHRPRQPALVGVGEQRRLRQRGASRSSTARVPSGVWSRGAKPVPPVVTTRPAKSWHSSRNAAATPVCAVGDDAAVDDLEAGGQQPLDQRGAGLVLTRPRHHTVGDGEHLRPRGQPRRRSIS